MEALNHALRWWRLGLLDGNKNPAGSAVDSYQHIAALVFVLHLGQILHINVRIAWRIGFKGLAWGLRLIERQPQLRTQINDQRFLRRMEGGLQSMPGMAGVMCGGATMLLWGISSSGIRYIHEYLFH